MHAHAQVAKAALSGAIATDIAAYGTKQPFTMLLPSQAVKLSLEYLKQLEWSADLLVGYSTPSNRAGATAGFECLYRSLSFWLYERCCLHDGSETINSDHTGYPCKSNPIEHSTARKPT